MHDALKRYVFFPLSSFFFNNFFHYFCWCCCFYCLSVRLLLILLLLLLLLLESNSYVQKCSLVWGKVLRPSFCVCVCLCQAERGTSRVCFFFFQIEFIEKLIYFLLLLQLLGVHTAFVFYTYFCLNCSNLRLWLMRVFAFV